MRQAIILTNSVQGYRRIYTSPGFNESTHVDDSNKIYRR